MPPYSQPVARAHHVQVPGDVGATIQVSGAHGIRKVHVSSEFVRWAAMQDESGNTPRQTTLSRDFDSNALDDVLCYGFHVPSWSPGAFCVVSHFCADDCTGVNTETASCSCSQAGVIGRIIST